MDVSEGGSLLYICVARHSKQLYLCLSNYIGREEYSALHK